MPLWIKFIYSLRQSVLVSILAILSLTNSFSTIWQGLPQWSPPERVPGFVNDTWPPLLIADQNRTVHAFSYQWLNEGEGFAGRAIEYSKWTIGQGWTLPIDILLPPFKNDARLLDVFLDQSGIVHLIFWGGDNTEANIYYSSASIQNAGNARAWSAPVLVASKAGDPENGVVFMNHQNYLTILFSGREDGNGLYTTSSNDLGRTWTEPVLVVNSNDESNFINDLKITKSGSELIYALWNEVNPGGQGRGIYFSKFRERSGEWSNPTKLAEAETGYGTNTPAMISYHNKILVFYNLAGKIWQLSSNDDGENWSPARSLFSRHVGVNGAISLVGDGNDELHMFFGQRITGSPDIHGMWHSVYRGDNWSEPEAIVSGPQHVDLHGDKAFDPFEARAVASQGNVLLVTWRQDPGLKGNGVWYSDQVLDAPELPLSVPPTVLPTADQNVIPSTITSSPSPNLRPSPVFVENSLNESTLPTQKIDNPTSVLLIAVIPVLLLISMVFLFGLTHKNHN
jgi:hypothetical protein